MEKDNLEESSKLSQPFTKYEKEKEKEREKEKEDILDLE